MSQLNITIHRHSYTVACKAGEEERLKLLARMVGERVERISDQLGQIGENKLLLMAALLLADELADATGNGANSVASEANGIAGTIDSAAARIEDIVARLEKD